MGGLSDNIKGALLMAASMLAYVLNDTMVKMAADSLSLFQTVFLRGVITVLLLGLFAWHKKQLFCRIDRKDWWVVILRLAGEVGATLCFLTALFNMPLANATAIMQALPLAITLGAAVFLGEPVGWRRYGAIIAGFIGVLVIVRPGAEGFNEYSLWALGAVAFVVLRDLATSRLSEGVPSLFVSFLTAVIITIFGGALAPTMTWQPVPVPALAQLAGAAIFIIFGYQFSIMTMRVGEISFSSPFRYTVLIWAVLLGIFVFGDIPDLWTIIGSTIVVLAGIYTFYRERRVGKLEIVSAEQSPRPEIDCLPEDDIPRQAQNPSQN